MWGEEEHEGGEQAGMLRWLLTYADLITLLLAFFIILYTLNRTQQIKFAQISAALAQEFDSSSIVGQSPGPSIINGDSGTQTGGSAPAVPGLAQDTARLGRLASRIETAIGRAGLGSQVTVSSNPRGVEVIINARLLFRSGSARVNPEAVRLLEEVGGALKAVPNDIEVAGYTDSVPIRTGRYPSNWQLSAARAANVVYILAMVPGIEPARLSVAAFSKYHPVASNATPGGRQLNRRVTILVLRKDVGEVAIGTGP